MAKEEFLSKWNLKDYNNVLEQILEQKTFSESTKNLLLSMLYKIENAYSDYSTVKRQVLPKKEFLEEIVQIIEEKCNTIDLVLPMSEKAKQLGQSKFGYLVQEQGEILVYPNEKMLLYALYELVQNKVCIPKKYDWVGNAICYLLSKGNSMAKSEVIRDFNGWSWDTQVKEIENSDCNIIYTNLIYLVGQDFLTDWIKNDRISIDYLKLFRERLKEYYQNDGIIFLEILYKTAILLYVNSNPEEKNKMLEGLEVKKSQYELLNNKKQFLEEMIKSKKEITDKIKEIDTLLSDENLLTEEYHKRNKGLPNKEKIFSVSHLEERLQKERCMQLYTINEYNRMLKPNEYIKKKDQLEQEINFLQDIGIQDDIEESLKQNILKLQQSFFICFNVKIQKAQTKKEVLDAIYQMRYYCLLPYQNGQMKDRQELQTLIETTILMLLKKGKELKLITEMGIEEIQELELLKRIVTSRIITFENIFLEAKKQEQELIYDIYDDTIFDFSISMPLPKGKFSIKKNKRNKLFNI